MATQSPFSWAAQALPDMVNQMATPPAWVVDEAINRLVLFLNHVLMSEPEAMARLASVSVDEQGRIAGIYGSGKQHFVGQLALVNFDNFEGLIPVGDNAFAASLASGTEASASGVLVGRAGNGIMGDMCIHMFDTARWLLDLGWPSRISSEGGIFVQKEGKSNIADTQTAVFEYPGLNCVWQHRSWGTPPDPDYPWGLTIYGEKGTLRMSTMRYDFTPTDSKAQKLHMDVVYEKEKYPEDLKEDRIELNAAPATRLHMLDFLAAIDQQKKPIADIEAGHISTASCIIANLSMKLGRPLSYDPIKKIIINDPEATALLARPYRQPWSRNLLK